MAPAAASAAAASPAPLPPRLADLRLRIRRPLASAAAPAPTFTRAEADVLFAAHDADGDGRIADGEWSRYHDPADAPLAALDLDGDGAVRAAEFVGTLLAAAATGTRGGDQGDDLYLAGAELEAAIAGPGVVVIGATATWCTFCYPMEATWRQVAAALAPRGVRMHVALAEQSTYTLDRLGAKFLPGTLIIKDGVVVERRVGREPAARLQAAVEAVL